MKLIGIYSQNFALILGTLWSQPWTSVLEVNWIESLSVTQLDINSKAFVHSLCGLRKDSIYT